MLLLLNTAWGPVNVIPGIGPVACHALLSNTAVRNAVSTTPALTAKSKTPMLDIKKLDC